VPRKTARAASTIVVKGFASATGSSQFGIVSGGTNAEETNVTGNRIGLDGGVEGPPATYRTTRAPSLASAPARHHEQVLVGVLGRAFGCTPILLHDELLELPVERRRTIGLLGEERVKPALSRPGPPPSRVQTRATILSPWRPIRQAGRERDRARRRRKAGAALRSSQRSRIRVPCASRIPAVLPSSIV
jgi:hypothetical protein